MSPPTEPNTTFASVGTLDLLKSVKFLEKQLHLFWRKHLDHPTISPLLPCNCHRYCVKYLEIWLSVASLTLYMVHFWHLWKIQLGRLKHLQCGHLHWWWEHRWTSAQKERHTQLSLILHGKGDNCKFYLARLSITNLCCASICMTTQALQSLLWTILFLVSILRHNSYTLCFSLCQIKLL